MDDNFVLSPAALWSCLIVFLLDPPPENFEQLTSGKHLLDRWLKFTFFFFPAFFKKLETKKLARHTLNFRKEVARYGQSTALYGVK